MNFFDILTKYPNLKKKLGRGMGGERGEGLVNEHEQMCFKWHFYSSKRTPVPNCSEIHA